MITDNKLLIDVAKRNYDKFLVPVNNVEAIKTKRYYTKAQVADLDYKSSVNKIGEDINLSQELNTQFWDKSNNGASWEELEEIYLDTCQLNVMSGLFIDMAKKEFDIDLSSELAKMRKKYLMVEEENQRTIKPNFFGHLARTKGYYDSTRKYYKKHDTTMDYLQNHINKYQLSRNNPNKHPQLPFSTCLDSSAYAKSQVSYKQINRILELVINCKLETANVFNSTLDNEEKFKLVNKIKTECSEYIGEIKLNNSTMYALLKTCELEKNKKISKHVINTLFGYPNESFFNLIIRSKENLYSLKECNSGDIEIFGKKYIKIKDE